MYNSTNNESISTTESGVSNLNNFYNAKRKNKCDQTLKGNSNTRKFLKRKNIKLRNIIKNSVDLKKELQSKDTQITVLDSPIFDATNFQLFKDKHNETLENPVRKKLKLGDNNKCITSENARHQVTFK